MMLCREAAMDYRNDAALPQSRLFISKSHE
jgi:hypothetical protein